MAVSTVDKIMDIAEAQVRAGGYNSFSFREISQEIGIKSASIHYHFPTKTDLGVAIASRYTSRFAEQLLFISATNPDARARLNAYTALFRQALVQDQKMCLCGQLASESDVLPEPIRLETRRFFTLNIDWLTNEVFAADGVQAQARAAAVLAALEGALLVSKVLQQPALFEQVVTNIAVV